MHKDSGQERAHRSGVAADWDTIARKRLDAAITEILGDLEGPTSALLESLEGIAKRIRDAHDEFEFDSAHEKSLKDIEQAAKLLEKPLFMSGVK